MRSERSRIATAVAGTTALLVVMLGIRPASIQQILSVYVLVLAGIALAALTRIARSASDFPPPSNFEAALRARAVGPTRPSELVRTEREITLGTSSAGNLHRRLLPILREAAAARLSAGHNVDLQRRPDAARVLLGEDAWELLRPDRPEPHDHNDPGIPMRRLRSVVSTLEKL
ncbi:MAG TPA: hypothetical protein VIL98_12935 [Gaiellaceae bacterium]